MKIERFFYGMIDGKVALLKTDGVNKILHDKSIQRLRELDPLDNHDYIWFPTEQVIAVPHCTMTNDDFGREFVKSDILLVKLHDYLKLCSPSKFFHDFIVPESYDPFEPLEVAE